MDMEEELDNKPKRGGSRPGAGRKLKDKVPTKLVAVRLRQDYLERIDAHFVRSDFIQKAVKEKLMREGLT